MKMKMIEKILLWFGAILLIGGILSNHLWEQWSAIRFAESLKILLLWVILLAIFAGLSPVLATAILVATAIILGGFLLPRESAILQALAGILLLAGVVGWLVLLPIHYGWGYLLFCVVLIKYRWSSLIRTLQAAYLQWNEAVAISPRIAAFCIMVLGLAAITCWLPVMQFDDQTYHLRLPWQLQEQGFYEPLPQYQIWAVAPWLSDIVQALTMLIGGREAVGAVNIFWLCCLTCGLWNLSLSLGASGPARWMSTIAGVSIPTTTALVMGMQTDLPIAAVLVWLFALVARPAEGGIRFWLTLAVLVGGLAAIKLPAIVMAIIPLLYALFRHPWPSPQRILIVFVTALVIAGSSYVYAWILTGNPVLPLFNAWFKSPFYYPVNMLDTNWKTGFGVDLFWSMSFDTARHVEGGAGYFGFLQIALSGVWLVSLLHRSTRMIALLSTTVFLLPLIPIQYVRYAYPGLIVLSSVLVTTAFNIDARRAVWLISGLCILHLSFQANGHWMLGDGAIRDFVMTEGRHDLILKKYAPERLIASHIRQSSERTGNVLVLNPPFAAEFGRRGRPLSGHFPALIEEAATADKDITGQHWVVIFQRKDISDIVFRSADIKPAQYNGLQFSGAKRRSVVGAAEWWEMP